MMKERSAMMVGDQMMMPCMMSMMMPMDDKMMSTMQMPQQMMMMMGDKKMPCCMMMPQGMDEKAMTMMMGMNQPMMMSPQKMPMASKMLRCGCGTVEMQLMGEPKMCAVCHCDDCQKASASACVANAFFDPSMVKVTKGMHDMVEFKLRTMPRMHCRNCHNFMYSNAMGMIAVNGNMYPNYKATVHMNCRFGKMLSMMMGTSEHTMPMPMSEMQMPTAMMPEQKSMSMPMDAKMMPMDAKMMPMDSKMMPMDAKMMPMDSKMMPMDSKMMPMDSKMMPMDSKMMPMDSKMMMPMDAKMMPMDAKMMMSMPCKTVACCCGSVEMELRGEPKMRTVCHCDDCQKASGAPCVASAFYDTAMVKVTKGQNDLTEFKLKTMPRLFCKNCHNYMYCESMGMIGVNGNMLQGFKPQMHVQCRYTKMKILDNVPKYFTAPKEFGGDGMMCK